MWGLRLRFFGYGKNRFGVWGFAVCGWKLRIYAPRASAAAGQVNLSLCGPLQSYHSLGSSHQGIQQLGIKVFFSKDQELSKQAESS